MKNPPGIMPFLQGDLEFVSKMIKIHLSFKMIKREHFSLTHNFLGFLNGRFLHSVPGHEAKLQAVETQSVASGFGLTVHAGRAGTPGEEVMQCSTARRTAALACTVQTPWA